METVFTFESNIKNLLSNAFKFTEKGEVCLKITEAHNTWKHGNINLDRAKKVIAFSITDTGIGIPQEKQSIIFEAFQQAEGSTSRKYGGTGLGLSISRGLAELLGGTIELESQAGYGSTFTLYLPIDNVPQINPKNAPQSIQVIQHLQMESKNSGEISNLLGNLRITNEGIESRSLDIVSEMINETGDDRSNILPEDKVILVVEDDLRFGKIVIDKAHEYNLKGIVATNYLEVFDFINRFSPIAITLDVKLPETSGWKGLDLYDRPYLPAHSIHVISGKRTGCGIEERTRSFLLSRLTRLLNGFR